MKKGFTLVEMLVVIGIISVLVGASLASFGKMMKSADKAKAQELVSNTATALAAIFESDGSWPKKIREEGKTDGRLDKDVAYVLAKRGMMSLTVANEQLAGKDRLGIVTPWAAKVIERKKDASLSTPVTGNSTVEDHLLHFAVDLDGDGIIEGASVGGEAVDIRATVAVWCIGKNGGNNGKICAYSEGLKKGDVYSWTKGQTQMVK